MCCVNICVVSVNSVFLFKVKEVIISEEVVNPLFPSIIHSVFCFCLFKKEMKSIRRALEKSCISY